MRQNRPLLKRVGHFEAKYYVEGLRLSSEDINDSPKKQTPNIERHCW